MHLANPQRRFINLFNKTELLNLSGNKTLTPAYSNVLTTASFNVIVDTFIMAQFIFISQKGGGAGRTAFRLFKSAGTGGLKYIDTLMTSGSLLLPLIEDPHQDAAEFWRGTAFWMFRASASGSIVLTLQGLSAGSDSTVLANQARFEYFLFL